MAGFLRKKQFWGAAIGLALLAYCVKDIKLAELSVLSHRLNPYCLIPAALSGFLFMGFKGLRWRLMISPQQRTGVRFAVTLYSTGQILSIVMPLLTGQLGRVLLFSREQKLGKTVVFSTMVLEVLFDAISLILFMLVTSLAFVFPREYRSLSFIVAGVTFGGLAFLYFILHYRHGTERISERCLRHRWPGLYITVKKFIRSFTKGIEMLRSSQHMLHTLILSVATWTMHMLVVWFLMLAFGFTLPFAAAAAVMIINTIVLMVPITPGNAGTFEVAVSTSLAAFSIGRSDAVLFALALHLLDLIPMFAYSFCYLHMQKVRLSEIKAEQEEEDILDRIDEEGAFIEEEVHD